MHTHQSRARVRARKLHMINSWGEAKNSKSFSPNKHKGDRILEKRSSFLEIDDRRNPRLEPESMETFDFVGKSTYPP